MFDCQSGIINPDCIDAVCICDDQEGYTLWVQDRDYGDQIRASLKRQNNFYRKWEERRNG